MTSRNDALLKELESCESTDPVIGEVARRLRAAMVELGIVRKTPALRVFVPDFGQASERLRSSLYFTEACISVLDPPTIVINADFLRETECAIRSFGIAEDLFSSPYLRNDACMFGLVKRMREDGARYLEKLRELERGLMSSERFAVDELTMTALFFCGHELGHLIDGVDAARYTSFLDPGKPLETRLAHAAVRMRRHAAHFQDDGFGLPGWEFAVRPEHEAFATTEAMRDTMRVEDQKDAAWFEFEKSADGTAADVMIRYLEAESAANPVRSARNRYLFVRGLFAAGLWAWYKDFLAFCERMAIPMAGNRVMLAFEMMQDQEAYVRAASLFGEAHRFTLLRSSLAIYSVVSAAPGAAGPTLLARAGELWASLFAQRPGSATNAREDEWITDSAHRHALLNIHMDTAVKFAFMGASMPWLRAKEQQRGSPQLLMIHYEAIDQSVARLRRLLQEKK